MSFKLKRKLNANGVIDSNSALFHFLIPSFFAAMLSAIMQGINRTTTTYVATRFTNATFTPIDRNYPNLR